MSLYARRLVESIRSRDRDPVIVIFGDHGPWLTRGARPGDVFDGKPLTDATIDLDRRGILLGVYPRDFCVDAITRLPDSARLFSVMLDCLERASP